jgi:hypothetical protein
LRQFGFLSCLTRITGTLRGDLGTFVIIYCSVLHRMGNVSDKNLRINQNTHFKFSNLFSENRAVYEIMWKKYGRVRQAINGNIIRWMYN